jgi:DNA polymerase-3 subunit delta
MAEQKPAAELKPAYLIHGGDESSIDDWRARLRARAEREGPEATLEVLRDERLTGDAAAAEITALTLGMGRRYVLADGVQRWKAGDVKPVTAALANLPPDTVVMFIAVGDPPKGLDKAVKGCGGEVRRFDVKKGKDSTWARDHARKLGVELEQDAADALVATIPRDDKKKRLRQQTLMRELEKLATFVGEGGTVNVDTVALLGASAVETQTYELADAVIEGNREQAIALAEKLLDQEVDMMVILYALRRKLRDAQRAWAMVNNGRSLAEVQSALESHPYVVKMLVSKVRHLDGQHFQRANDLLAELDWSIRGGSSRDQDSALTLMLAGAA